MRVLGRLAALCVLVAAMMIGATGVAAAHAVLVSTEPAKDAQLTVGPDRVAATFNERLQTSFAAMTVVGPGGKHLWSTGEPQVEGATVSIGLRPLGPTGRYTVNYRVTSADGHAVSGSWQFELTVAGSGTPGPALASNAAGDEPPTWPFVVGTVVLVAGGAFWAMRRRP